MEVIHGRSTYMDMARHYHMESALRSLVTPPRGVPKPGARRSSLGPLSPPPSGSKSSPRVSPSQLNGKGGFYAGAKFGERPSPADLPEPPVRWLNDKAQQSCVQMTETLKVLLKVQS